MKPAHGEISQLASRWWPLGILVAFLGYLFYAGYSFGDTKRERTRVALMLSQGKVIERSIEAYFSKHRAFPQSASMLDLPQRFTVGSNPARDDEDPGLVAFSYDVTDGRVSLTFEQSQGALSGQSIILEPSLDANGVMKWSCVGGTVNEVYRPPICRARGK